MQGDAVLNLAFQAPYGTKAAGLYVSTWKGERTLATQLQATSARDMFPCFDEPMFKATFLLSVHVTLPSATPYANWRVLSNMPHMDDYSTGAVHSYHFQATPRMSTYLLALVVAPLTPLRVECASGVSGVSAVCITVWTYPGDEACASIPYVLPLLCWRT